MTWTYPSQKSIIPNLVHRDRRRPISSLTWFSLTRVADLGWQKSSKGKYVEWVSWDIKSVWLACAPSGRVISSLFWDLRVWFTQISHEPQYLGISYEESQKWDSPRGLSWGHFQSDYHFAAQKYVKLALRQIKINGNFWNLISLWRKIQRQSMRFWSDTCGPVPTARKCSRAGDTTYRYTSLTPSPRGLAWARAPFINEAPGSVRSCDSNSSARTRKWLTELKNPGGQLLDEVRS